MNLANLAALGLLVVGLGFLLFGAYIGSYVLFGDTERIMQDPIPGAPDIPPFFVEIVRRLPWLVAIALSLFFAIPGGFLAAGGLAVWHLVGRRHVSQLEKDYSLQPVRESSLRIFLDELVHGVVKGESGAGNLLQVGLRGILPQLDSQRRSRLLGFITECGWDGGAGESAAYPPEPDPPLEQRILLARAGALLCFLLSSAFGLWSVVVFIATPLAREFYSRSIGLLMDGVDATYATLFCLILAVLPAVFAAGFLGLSRIDRRLLERSREFRRRAEEVLLEGYRRQMAELAAGGIAEDTHLRRVARALTRASLAGLGSGGRKALQETLRQLGLTNAGIV